MWLVVLSEPLPLLDGIGLGGARLVVLSESLLGGIDVGGARRNCQSLGPRSCDGGLLGGGGVAVDSLHENEGNGSNKQFRVSWFAKKNVRDLVSRPALGKRKTRKNEGSQMRGCSWVGLKAKYCILSCTMAVQTWRMERLALRWKVLLLGKSSMAAHAIFGGVEHAKTQAGSVD